MSQLPVFSKPKICLATQSYLLARYTQAFINFVEPQIEGLVEETIKRLQFMPFDVEGRYIAHGGGKSSTLLIEICALAGISLPVVYSITPGWISPPVHKTLNCYYYVTTLSDVVELDLKTCISGRRSTKGGVMKVRGLDHPVDQMPLYLNEGSSPLDYVFPVFDWSDAQVDVALAKFLAPFVEA